MSHVPTAREMCKFNSNFGLRLTFSCPAQGVPWYNENKNTKKKQIRFPRTATSDWESCSREMAIADQELKTEPPYLLTLTQGVSIFQWGHPNVPL